MRYAPTYKKHWIIIFLFSLALLLRILHIYFIVPNPFFHHPVGDEKEHYEWALKIIEGDVFSVHKGAFFRSPGYPYFLAFLLFITGENLFLVRILQAIIGSFSVVLIYLIAEKKFGKKVALLSGFISAGYPLFIYYSAMLLDTTFYIFLVLLVLFFSLKIEEKKTCLWVFLSGLFMAFNCIIRPNLLIFIPFHIVWIAIMLVSHTSWRQIYSDLIQRWKFVAGSIILYLIPIFIIISSIMLRNYLLEKDFYLIATNGDLNFYLANNPDKELTLNLRPGLEWEMFLQTPYLELGENISKKEVQLFWRKKYLDYIKKRPFIFLLDKVVNLYNFFDGYEYREIQMYDYYFKQSPILKIPISFYIISPLSLIGIAFGIRKFRENNLLILFVGVYAFSVVLFFVYSRYRLPIVPVLIMFASYTVVRMIGEMRKRYYYCFAIVYSVFLAYFYIFYIWNQPDERETVTRHLCRNNLRAKARVTCNKPDEKTMESWWTHYNLGLVYYDEGDFNKAITELREAEEIRSDNMDTHYVLANVYKKSFRFREAIGKFKVVLKELKEKYIVYNVIISRIDKEIGECYLKTRDSKSAEKYYLEALSFDNTDAVTYNALGIIESYKGNKDNARKLFEDSLKLKPDYQDAKENLKRL